MNGRAEALTTEPDRPLLDVLREDLGLTGPKYGCGEGACRACTVLVDGRSTISCMTRVDAVAELLGIEDLLSMSPSQVHPAQGQRVVSEDAIMDAHQRELDDKAITLIGKPRSQMAVRSRSGRR